MAQEGEEMKNQLKRILIYRRRMVQTLFTDQEIMKIPRIFQHLTIIILLPIISLKKNPVFQSAETF